MAENDRFEKHLGAGWRTAANYAEGEKASVEEIGDKIVESLVNYLRDYNGVPSFQEIVLALKAPVGPSPTEHFSTLEDIVRDQKGHRHTKVAANEAMSLLVISRKLEPVDVEVRLAQAICSALVKHYFFARVCPKMTATERFSDHSRYTQTQRTTGRKRTTYSWVSFLGSWCSGGIASRGQYSIWTPTNPGIC